MDFNFNEDPEEMKLSTTYPAEPPPARHVRPSARSPGASWPEASPLAPSHPSTRPCAWP